MEDISKRLSDKNRSLPASDEDKIVSLRFKTSGTVEGAATLKKSGLLVAGLVLAAGSLGTGMLIGLLLGKGFKKK